MRLMRIAPVVLRVRMRAVTGYFRDINIPSGHYTDMLGWMMLASASMYPDTASVVLKLLRFQRVGWGFRFQYTNAFSRPVGADSNEQ